MNSLLHDVARSLKKVQHVESVVSHHGLIRLIVSHSLTQQQSSWEEPIEIIEGGLATPSPKRKHSSSTPERSEKGRESVTKKPVASTPEQPERPRKSARLARIRGRLKKIQVSTSQPIEITDEPSEAEGEQSEERAEQSREESEQSGEGNEEGDEHSETEAEVEHSKAATEQSNQEEEMGQLEGSPPQDPVGEDELATVLANMGEYGQPSSPPDLPDEPPEENISEKSHAVEA